LFQSEPDLHSTRRHPPTTFLRLLFLLALVAVPGGVEAQVLPPIYKPLPIEEGERFRASADSFRIASADAARQAEALEEGARRLRQNGTGVAERLLDEAGRVAEQASRLERQLEVDAATSALLRTQAADLRGRAEDHELRMERHREELALQSVEGDPDSFLGEPTPPGLLESEIRSDSTLAVSFRQQSRDLIGEAEALVGNIASATQRILSLRQQEEQLRAYGAEIASGRAENEPIASRLDAEASGFRRTAELLSQDARRQGEMAEILRVQADRLGLPVRNREDAMRFYGEDGRAVLRTLVLSVGEGGRSGSINSELVSDYAGPLRIGVGFVLAEARDSGEEEIEGEVAPASRAALERFYAGGGNFVVYSAFPLAFHRSPYHSLTVQSLNKVALDIPGVRHRAAAEEIPTNLDVGVEVYGTFNSYGGRIKAFALLRSAAAIGNGSFYSNLGRQGGAFAYGQLTLGAEVASVAKVLLSGAHAPEGLEREVWLTFQVAR